MAKLWEVTKLVRSKNAGPFVLTFDIMFDDPDVYEKVRDSGALNKKLVADIYKQKEDDVLFFNCDNALAIKFSIPRPTYSGDLEDGDCYGGQQYAPLLDIEVPVDSTKQAVNG